MDSASGLSNQSEQHFGQSNRSTRNNFHRIAGGQPLEVGGLNHITIINSQSNEDIDQLQQDLRQMSNKTLTAEWFMVETAADKLKLLNLFQTGMSYTHYSNGCRKQLLKDMQRQNQRLERDVKQKKKEIEKQREKLYDMKDEYHIKKEALKQYRGYLEKLHYCQKCKKMVRNVHEHQIKHDKDQKQPKEMLGSNRGGASQEMITTLLKQNQVMLEKMEQLTVQVRIYLSQNGYSQENVKQLLDELKTIKLQFNTAREEHGMSEQPSAKQQLKATVAVGRNEINQRPKSPGGNLKLARPPSMNQPNLMPTKITVVDEVASPIAKRLTADIQFEKEDFDNVMDLLNHGTDLPDRSIVRQAPDHKSVNSLSFGQLQQRIPSVDSKTVEAQSYQKLQDIDMPRQNSVIRSGGYSDKDFQLDDDQEENKQPQNEQKRKEAPEPPIEPNKELFVGKLKPQSKLHQVQQPHQAGLAGLPSKLSQESRIVPQHQESKQESKPFFQQLSVNSHAPRRKGSTSYMQQQKLINDLTKDVGPASQIQPRSHQDFGQSATNQSTNPDLQMTLSVINSEGASNSNITVSVPSITKKLEEPKNVPFRIEMEKSTQSSFSKKMGHDNVSSTLEIPDADLRVSKDIPDPKEQQKSPQIKQIESLNGIDFMPQANLIKTKGLDEPNSSTTKQLEPKTMRSIHMSKPLPAALNNIDEQVEEQNNQSQMNKPKEQKKQVVEEISRGKLNLTTKDHGRQLHEQYQKILGLKEQKVNLHDKQYQADIKKQIDTVQKCLEQEFYRMFDAQYTSLSKENPMTIATYIRQASEKIQFSRSSLQAMRKKTNQSNKRNSSQHSLEVSKSDIMSADLKQVSGVMNKSQNILDLSELKQQSTLKLKREDSVVPKPTLSRNNSIKQKQIKNFDLDDPLESIIEDKLKSELAKKNDAASEFSDD